MSIIKLSIGAFLEAKIMGREKPMMLQCLTLTAVKF
jgi:hypothetical protein